MDEDARCGRRAETGSRHGDRPEWIAGAAICRQLSTVSTDGGLTPAQANQREESYKEQIKTLTTKLKQVAPAQRGRGGKGSRGSGEALHNPDLFFPTDLFPNRRTVGFPSVTYEPSAGGRCVSCH
jgi:hypothetical protein